MRLGGLDPQQKLHSLENSSKNQGCRTDTLYDMPCGGNGPAEHLAVDGAPPNILSNVVVALFTHCFAGLGV